MHLAKSGSIIFFISTMLLQFLIPGNLCGASPDKKKPPFGEIPSYLNRTTDHQESINTYTQIIQKKPYDPVARYNRATVYFAMGMYDQAIADYDKAISLRPRELQPYIGKLGALYALGKYQEVFDLSNQILSDFNKHPWGYYWRGRACLAKGQSLKAIEDFNFFLEKEDNPERIADVCYFLGSAYYESGEFNAAINQLNMAIVKNPLNFENLVLRGLVYKSKLEYAHALNDLKRGFQLSRNSSSLACNSIAWILATCPNPDFRNGEEAVKMARKAVELDGSKPYYHDTLAAAYAESGMFREAVEEQKKALKLLDKVPGAQRGEISSRYQKRLDSYSNLRPFRDVEE
ncbi:MAG: tetratricopeptide repeat protein [Syntrophobacteraceae bacterium]